MITQHVRHGSCYRHRGLRSSTGPRTHRASSSYIQGMSLQARPESIHIDRVSPIFSARAVLKYLVGLRRSLASVWENKPVGENTIISLKVGLKELDSDFCTGR